MEHENPLIAFVRALAKRQARIDATPPPPANDDLPAGDKAREK